MDLVVEVRQVVFGRPDPNLLLGPIVVPVVVVTIAVVVVQPFLIVALELVVEDDPLDSRATLVQALSGFQIGAVDLGVMLQFPRSFEAGVEGLRSTSVLLAVSLEKVATSVGQDHH
jgi:hypothetical protein